MKLADGSTVKTKPTNVDTDNDKRNARSLSQNSARSSNRGSAPSLRSTPSVSWSTSLSWCSGLVFRSGLVRAFVYLVSSERLWGSPL